MTKIDEIRQRALQIYAEAIEEDGAPLLGALLELMCEEKQLYTLISPGTGADFVVQSHLVGVLCSHREPGTFALVCDDDFGELCEKCEHLEQAEAGHACEAGEVCGCGSKSKGVH